MNERIKELAGQAGFKPYYDIGTGEVDPDGQAVTLPNWSTTDPWISMVQKFAELIVRECIAQCNDGDSQYFIAKHFGVEDPKTYLKQGYEE